MTDLPDEVKPFAAVFEEYGFVLSRQAVVPADPPPAAFCARCSGELPPVARFCPECGQPAVPATAAAGVSLGRGAGTAYYFFGPHPKQGFDMEHVVVYRPPGGQFAGSVAAGLEEYQSPDDVRRWFEDHLEEPTRRVIAHYGKLLHAPLDDRGDPAQQDTSLGGAVPKVSE